MHILLTLIAFLVALSVLVAVHEWGHYRVAVACGVKVLRFSIGLGPVVLRFKPRRQRAGQETEFVISAVPFGGYVKMLDEREGEVAEAERHLAFNTQPLLSRALIVAAGPVTNLALAVLLYSALQWIGAEEPKAILATPAAGSLAARAGLESGDTVRRAALAGDELAPVASFEGLRWLLARGALDGQDVTLEVARGAGGRVERVTLPLAGLDTRNPDERMIRAIGVTAPFIIPKIGVVDPHGAAHRAGLLDGDVVQSVDGSPIRDEQQLRDLIHAAGANGQPPAQSWQVERAGRVVTLQVRPDSVQEKGERKGYLGIGFGGMPEMVLVRQGPLDGLWGGALRTWEVAGLTLRVMGRMVAGQVSVKSLSGPIGIAAIAGKSAAMGLVAYLTFLALLSVSLGVLNLLPVPVLDGGQLMYYLWEAVTGKPVAGVWFERLQYLGITLLLAVMAIATFNDVVSRMG